MHPKALIDHCAELIAQTLTFAHPADATVSQYCREQRSLGSRERPLLADAVYALLREKPLLEWLLKKLPAPKALPSAGHKAPRPAKGAKPAPAPSAKARALALLALRQQTEFLAQAATAEELVWLDACRALEASPPADQPPACRHGLPDWLAAALQAELESANGWDRLMLLPRYADSEIGARALENFEPAVPVTLEGLAYAGGGFAIGYGVIWGLVALVARGFRRRRGVAA